MFSLFKSDVTVKKVAPDQVQVTYQRYRMQALMSIFLGYLEPISIGVYSTQ